MGSDIGNAKSEAVAQIINVDSLPVDVSSEGNTETNDAKPNTRLEESTMTSEPPTNSTEHQPPSSPMMDLETDFPSGETSCKLNPKIICCCSSTFLY